MAGKTKTKTKKTTIPAIDWSPVPRGPVGACAQAAVGLVALAGAADLADVSPVLGIAGAGVGVLSHTLAGIWRDYSPAALAYRIACWSGAGTWWTWTQIGDGEHLWATTPLAALAIGVTCAGITAPIGRHQPKTAATTSTSTELVPMGVRTLATRPGGQLGFEWEMRFRRVCKISVTVEDIRPWGNAAGYDVFCQLPTGPHTRKHIETYGEALAADARLPEGCGVEPKPGVDRSKFVLGVTTVNRMGNAGESVRMPYPDDYGPRSILEPLELGEHRDSTIADISIREESVLIVGRKRGGKTNQLDVLTLAIGRCTDALNWHIDMNGGGMSQPWLYAWLEGEIDTPPVDWCAPNPEEALLMTTIALAIARDRKTSYRTLKMQTNSKLLPISDKLPEIVITVDESAELMSPANRDPLTRQIRDNLEEIQRIAGNEAVNTIFCSLRPTQDMIAPAILKQSGVKMALYGLDEPDLGHLYGWQRGISMEDLPTKGCAFLATPEHSPRPMKGWFLEPERIREASKAIAALNPRLDAASVEVANAEYAIDFGNGKPQALDNIYAGRHQRMREAFTGNAETAGKDLVQRQAAPATPAKQDPPAAPKLRVVDGSASNWPDPLNVRNNAPAPAASAADWPDPLPGRTPQPAPAVRPATQPAALPAGQVPEILQRALQVFITADDDRVHSEDLAQALNLNDKWALAKALQPYGVSPRPKFVRNGRDGRGYWRSDIEAAISNPGQDSATA